MTALHPLVYLSCHFLLQYVYMSKKNLPNPSIFLTALLVQSNTWPNHLISVSVSLTEHMHHLFVYVVALTLT
jgi:hypothetical protein